MSEELSPSTGALLVCYRTGEMSGKEGENFRPRVCGGRFTILEPMTETTHARRQFRVVEGMVGAGVDREIEDGTAISGPCHQFAAIRRRVPVIIGADQDHRRRGDDRGAVLAPRVIGDCGGKTAGKELADEIRLNIR